MGSPLGNDSGGMGPAPRQTSAQMNTSTGSGSRPGNSKTMTPTSHPMNARTLDRDPPAGWLGSGSTKKQGD